MQDFCAKILIHASITLVLAYCDDTYLSSLERHDLFCLDVQLLEDLFCSWRATSLINQPGHDEGHVLVRRQLCSRVQYVYGQ